MSDPSPLFDEMLTGPDAPRRPYESYYDWFRGEDIRQLKRKSAKAEAFSGSAGSTPSMTACGISGTRYMKQDPSTSAPIAAP